MKIHFTGFPTDQEIGENFGNFFQSGIKRGFSAIIRGNNFKSGKFSSK